MQSDPPGDSPIAPLSVGDWQARYDEGRTGWDRGGPSPWLDACVREGSLAPCRILVPGCGRGHEVVALARAGFDVTGVDFAPAAVAAVRRRLADEGLAARIVEGDVFAFEPGAKFAAVYEQTCLCALPPARWEEYERRLADWIAPGGVLAVAFMQTDAPQGPPFACRPGAMRSLFAGGRWEWPAELTPIDHPAGLVELAGILRRKAPPPPG